MAKLIKINQNPQRYNQKVSGWEIQAQAEITPISLQAQSEELTLNNLIASPDFKVNGVIVKIVDGETITHLISNETLQAIRDSRNPHYNPNQTGTVRVKGKDVVMGKSVRIIPINIESLKSRAEELDTQNRKATVGFVDYVYEGDNAAGTSIPFNLIKQINYTLNPDIERPEDKFGINLLNLGDDTTIYNITQLNTQTRQSDGTLDKSKLEKALRELNARLTIMQDDFNMIKDVFYNGTFPESLLTSDFVQRAQTVSEEDEFPTVFKYSRIVSVQNTPNTTPPPTGTGDGAGGTNGGTEAPPPGDGQPASTTPPVIGLRMRKKRDLKANRIGVFENDPTVGDKGRRKRLIKEGDSFFGYFFKDWEHGQKIWAVYEADKTTLIGWGIADRNDFVDPI